MRQVREKRDREEAERLRKQSVERRRLEEQKLELQERERLKYQMWEDAARQREQTIMNKLVQENLKKGLVKPEQPYTNIKIIVEDPELGYYSS